MKLDLLSTFAVLQPDQSVVPVAVTPTIYEELDQRFEGFRGRTLVSCYRFEKDWPSWERHPAGDELVCLLSGAATLVFARDAGAESVVLDKPGTCVLVPKGTWHTARIRVPTTMLFITPGEGTQNRAV